MRSSGPTASNAALPYRPGDQGFRDVQYERYHAREDEEPSRGAQHFYRPAVHSELPAVSGSTKRSAGMACTSYLGRAPTGWVVRSGEFTHVPEKALCLIW